MIGIDSLRYRVQKSRNKRRLRKDFKAFKDLLCHTEDRLPLNWENRRCIYEDTGVTNFDAHYIYHLAWAARILAKTRPAYHVDISSKLDFPTIVSAFIPVRFYDYRPAKVFLSDLTSEHADLVNLPFEDNSVPSLSCMHVNEHIGLGRYGDSIDPDGDLKAMRELARSLAPGGTLLFAVPIGKPIIIFNAHRIYSYAQIVSYFKGLELKEFVLIPDNAQEVGMLSGATPEQVAEQDYGCGCFWFTKP